MPRLPHTIRSRFNRVRLFLCDVDGVLTDGGVWMGGGLELKRFDIRDGLGLKFLQKNGIKVGWISRRPSEATRQRADNLAIDFLIQSDSDKVAAVESLRRETRLEWPEIAFVGDDIVDIGVFRRVGLAVAVNNATPETKAAAHYVTLARGGHGAIRETAELILKAQQKWKPVLSEYEG